MQEIKKGQIWEHLTTGEIVKVEKLEDGYVYLDLERTTNCDSFLMFWKLVEDHNDIVYKTEFKTITDSIASLLEYKNEKYGNAALEPLNIFTNKTQVGQRIDDKLARIKNSNELRKNDVADLIGYLLLECKFRGWNNFDEFKD